MSICSKQVTVASPEDGVSLVVLVESVGGVQQRLSWRLAASWHLDAP